MDITRNKLYRLYIKRVLSIAKIADLYNVNSGTVFYYLNKFKIKIRKLRGQHAWNYKGGSRRFPKCKDCKKRLSKLCSIRCKQCDLIFRKDVNGRNYKYGKTYNNKCIDCSKKISWKSLRCSLCAGKQHGQKYKGKAHPNYINGNGYSGYSLEFFKIKDIIRKRDNFECQNCDTTEEEHITVYGKTLTVHHIDYNKKNNRERNLITLCNSCNLRANFNRIYWENRYKNLIKIKA